MAVLALQAVTPEDLVRAVPTVTLAEARKLVAAVHRGDPVAASSAVRRSSAQAVAAAGEVPGLTVVTETASAIDPFVKYLLAAPDGARLEAVRIPLEHPGRFTVCVSSQVGCALGCAFCATGRLGLTRNLAAWEIVEQVRIVRDRLATSRVPTGGTLAAGRFRSLLRGGPESIDPARVPTGGTLAAGRFRSLLRGGPESIDPARVPTGGTLAAGRFRSLLRGGPESIDPARVHGVVFQGMGEPLANLDAVVQAIRVFSEPSALAIDARAITVCTAGLPSGIRRLAVEAPRVRLALSISSAIAAHRKAVMPIADRHDLDDVIAAAADHARATGLAPMWAVTLLDGVNDGADDAHALADRAVAFHAATGVRPRLSLLDYNPIGDGDRFTRSPRMPAFRDVLSAAGLPSHRRYSGGADVAAACGQLAGAAAAI
jgi:adenine C2-methylase RlmN of 23S rRNA A2503 and tRNA A37